jgi:hypothetical protein
VTNDYLLLIVTFIESSSVVSRIIFHICTKKQEYLRNNISNLNQEHLKLNLRKKLVKCYICSMAL